MKCIKCGAELASDSKFCNVCGEPVPQGSSPALVVENVTESPMVAPVVPETVTEAPVIAPVVPEPVTEAPVIAPVVLEPVTEAPAVEPVVLEPVTEAPVIAPVVLEPVTEAPVVEPVVVETPSAPAPVEVPTEAPSVAAPAGPVEPAPAAPVANNAQPPKKSNVGVILTIILLIVIAAVGGIFVGKNLFKEKGGEDEKPGVENLSSKTKVSFSGMEYEIPSDYEYYYDEFHGSDCLIVEMSNDLELLIYDTGYSYYVFENSFEKVVKESYPDAITTYKKDNKYGFVNYRAESEGYIYYFYDGVVNIKDSHGLGTIIAKLDVNLSKDDFNKAMNILDTAKKSRAVERSQGETDKFSEIKNRTYIDSYLVDTTTDSEVPEEE